MHEYNLISESWLPCYTIEGDAVELGIAETLSRAHELSELRDQSPLVTAALHRFLLAVVHRSVDGPRNLAEWNKIYNRGKFDENLTKDYLSKWTNRFDLFDAAHPFYQIGRFEISGKNEREDKSTSVSKLAQELSAGNNKTLFDHTVEEREFQITPAEAARRLVGIQAFALGGGVGSTSNLFGKHPNLTHAPLVGGLTTILRGMTLFETLALNLLIIGEVGPTASTEIDRPTWEDEPFPPRERRPLGYLDYLTWNSRSVRLIPEMDEGSELVVRRMYYTQGQSMPQDIRRPEWGYRIDLKRGQLPLGLRAERAVWRDSSVLLTSSSEPGFSDTRPFCLAQAARLSAEGSLPRARALTCFVAGFANNKASVLLWRLEELPVPAAILEASDLGSTLRQALDGCEQASRAVRDGVGVLIESLKKGFQGLKEVGERVYWQKLEIPFRRFIISLPADPDAAFVEWANTVKTNARAALRTSVENAQARSARELHGRVMAERKLNQQLERIELFQVDEGGWE